MDLLAHAKAFAAERHAGQMYGEQTYLDGHLLPIVADLVASFPDDIALQAAGALHDVVEDTPTPIAEVRTHFGDDVGDLVWAVTSEKGKNRKERNAATYPKIRAAGVRAIILKLKDRKKNLCECWTTRDPKLFMYFREYPDFRRALRREEDGPVVLALWDEIDKMLGWWEPSKT